MSVDDLPGPAHAGQSVQGLRDAEQVSHLLPSSTAPRGSCAPCPCRRRLPRPRLGPGARPPRTACRSAAPEHRAQPASGWPWAPTPASARAAADNDSHQRAETGNDRSRKTAAALVACRNAVCTRPCSRRSAPETTRRRSRSPANPLRRQLLLRRRQQLLGLVEAPEPDQGERMIRERAPRLGQDGGALADGGTGGRDEECQRLVHATGPGQAPAQQRVQAGARHSVGLREGIHRVEDGRRADGSSRRGRAAGPRARRARPGRVQWRASAVDHRRRPCRAREIVVEADRATRTRSHGSVVSPASAASSRAACSCRPLM